MRPESFVDMDDAFRALCCLVIDPMLHSVLIKGPSGSGKSTFIYSFSEALIGGRPVTIPQNVTDERLFGSIDIEQALSTGNIEFEAGLMSDENAILLADDFNLFSGNMSLTIMNSVIRGKVHLEREGFSIEYPCATKIIATANDREQSISSAQLDLFDMCIVIPRGPNLSKRMKVIRFDSEDWQDEGMDPMLVDRLEKAKARIDSIRVDDRTLKSIVEVMDRYGVEGIRGGLSAARVCRASAALRGHVMIDGDDISFALRVCTPHRSTRRNTVSDVSPDRVQLFMNITGRNRSEPHKEQEKEPEKETEAEAPKPSIDTENLPDSYSDQESDDSQDTIVLEMDKIYDSLDLLEDARKKSSLMDKSLARRYYRTSDMHGRYVSSVPADNDTEDLAIDATIRYAAPYQKRRRESDLYGDRGNVIILPSDLRKKVREKKTSCLYYFMIDNSGSLVVRARIRAVKAAIMSILTDHYVRKDRVAIMTFNEQFIGMALPPTRSVGRVKKIIDDIAVGTKTPLSESLVFMNRYVEQYLRKNKDSVVFVILITDAKANMALEKDHDPVEEAIGIASRIDLERMECAVVDSKISNEPNMNAIRLAKALRAPYYKLEDLRSSEDIIR